MFFSVARLRLSIAFLLATSLASAHENSLFTSSVSYCTPPESILIETFEIAYFPKNSSVSFNVTASSVLPNINVTADLLVNVYGMQLLNLSINLCDTFSGILCPLPQLNFNGAESLQLPSSLDIASKLPGIAFVMPDIEAFAQLTLTEIHTGEVKACIQATLANGWSTRQRAVEWSAGAIALLALLSAIVFSLTADLFALAPIRLFDVIYLFQTIATSGLLGLNYPIVYRAYALNFAWAIGLFAQSPSSPMQTSIDDMRNKTGGTVSTSTSSAVSLVNRKLSPYNTAVSSTYVVPQSLVAKVAALPKVNLVDIAKRGVSTLHNGTKFIERDVATVTAESDNVLEAGVPIFVNEIGIATENAFMTMFFTVLIFTAIVLGALTLTYGVVMMVNYSSWGGGKKRVSELRRDYFQFARAWGLRALLVTLAPVFIFAFYQWTLKDSWLAILLSVILFVVVLVLVLPPTYFAIMTIRSSEDPTPSLAPLTTPFLSNRIYYIAPLLLAIFVKALLTAFARDHGLVQVIITLVVEVILFILLVVLKPYRTRRADIFEGFLSLVRVVCTGLMIAFATSLDVAAIPRTVIGCVIAVIFSVTVIIMFINILANIGVFRLIRRAIPWRRGRRHGDRALASNASQTSSDLSVAEKGKDDEVVLEKSVDAIGRSDEPSFDRPSNPSPEYTLSTAPLTPLTASLSPLTTNSERPSLYTASTPTTLGETLPHRWSFHHSRPPSSSDSSVPGSPKNITSSPPIPAVRLHSNHPSLSHPPIQEHVQESET